MFSSNKNVCLPKTDFAIIEGDVNIWIVSVELGLWDIVFDIYVYAELLGYYPAVVRAGCGPEVNLVSVIGEPFEHGYQLIVRLLPALLSIDLVDRIIDIEGDTQRSLDVSFLFHNIRYASSGGRQE